MASVRRAHCVEQRPVVRDQDQRARRTRAARPPAPRGSRGRGGSWARPESAGWRPTGTRIASDSRRRSPPDRPATGFSASAPENRKRPEQRSRLAGGEPGGALGRLEHRALLADLLRRAGRGSPARRCDPCAACRARAAAAPPASRSAWSCRRRSGPPASRARRARATSRRRRAGACRRRPGSRPPAPAPRDRCGTACRTRSRVARPSRGRALDPVHLLELLDPRLRLARAGASTEAGHEALEPLDLRLLALDGAARAPARERPAPCARRATGRGSSANAQPRAPAPRCRPTRGTSGRGRRGSPPRPPTSAAAPAIRATRCRGGWWARRAAAGRDRQRACARASRASARRPRRCSAGGRGRPRGSPARARWPSRARARCSRRRARAWPERRRSGRACRRPRRRPPSPARAAPARARAPSRSPQPSST